MLFQNLHANIQESIQINNKKREKNTFLLKKKMFRLIFA